MLRIATHLIKSRHGIFYFRFVIPKRLRAWFGNRTEICRSLSTNDPKRAKIMALALSTAVVNLVERHNKNITRIPQRPLTPEEAAKLLRGEDFASPGTDVNGSFYTIHGRPLFCQAFNR